MISLLLVIACNFILASLLYKVCNYVLDKADIYSAILYTILLAVICISFLLLGYYIGSKVTTPLLGYYV